MTDHLIPTPVEMEHHRLSITERANHLWIQDGERIVCTECGLDLEDFKKGTPHDE